MDEATAEQVAGEIFADLRDALCQGKPINLTNILTITPYMRKARKYRHPTRNRDMVAPSAPDLRITISPAFKGAFRDRDVVTKLIAAKHAKAG